MSELTTTVYGGYYISQSLSMLLASPAYLNFRKGSLAYIIDNASFYKYNGTTWESTDFVSEVNINNTTQEVVQPDELPEYLESLDRGSKYIIYVDPNHANGSDSKDNKGNSPLRPFKTIERACLQAARKSFKSEGSTISPNDFTERVTIYLAPATYYVNNGLGGVTFDLQYGRRQDASFLILANKDWLISRAYQAADIDTYIDTVSVLTNERNRLRVACTRDLNLYISALANDIAVAGNYNIIKAANTIKPLDFIPAYDNADERSYTVAALNKIRDDIQAYVIKNTTETVGGVYVPGIIPDEDVVNPCAGISSEVAVLLEILTATLQVSPNTPPELSSASNGLYNIAFPESGEPSENNLQSFNNAYKAGIILPRGVSIIGADLRKVIIRPKYVPVKTGEEGQSAIFRMTGGNFFSGFTIRDKEGLLESHHNLSSFEFCKKEDLEDYYDNIVRVFKDNTEFNLLFDSSNLLYFNTSWLVKKIYDLQAEGVDEIDRKNKFVNFAQLLVISISGDLRDQTSNKFKDVVGRFKEEYITPLDTELKKTTARESYSAYFRYLYDYMVEVISNRANLAEGGYIDPRVPVDANNPTNPCQNIQAILYNFYQLFDAILASTAEGDPYTQDMQYTAEDVESVSSENKIVGTLGTNTVSGASPYIYSATLRSEWGLNGIDGDGALVAGFKSYLAAQFTVISLQRDPDAFVNINDAGEVANKRYKGTRHEDFVGLTPNGDWRHYGYRVSNEAYAQLVSCFCIGPAVHYWCDSGAEFSITNSTSNFGDVSLQSIGYVGQNDPEGGGAYVQDKGYKLIAVKPPFPLNTDPNEARSITIGNVAAVFSASAGTGRYIGTNLAGTAGTITLENPINQGNIEPYTVDIGNQVYVRLPLAGEEAGTIDFEELYAVVTDITDNRVISVTFPYGIWPNAAVSTGDSQYNTIIGKAQTLIGSSISIKRLIDTRAPEDKVHKLLIRKPASGSRGKPIENFILRAKKTETQPQFPFALDNVWYVGKSEYSIEEDEYLITMLGAYADVDGLSELNSGYYPTIDLNFDPTSQTDQIVANPTNTSTYRSTSAILDFLGLSANDVDTAMELSSTVRYITEQDIEFNKPSTIRCGGQTWEYVGYYNYDTAIPQNQQFQLGEGKTNAEKSIIRLKKLQNAVFGGRIYATGLDEEGNSYVGTKVTNTRTGEEIDTRLIGTAESLTKSYSRLNIVSALNLLSGSALTISSGASLKLDAGSSITIPGYPNEIIDAKARYIKTTQGADIINPGFSQPATYDQTSNERSLTQTDNGFTYVTPATLGQWRKDKNLVSQRTGTTKVYVGNWFGISAVRYSRSYLTFYWPEPSFPTVPESGNPGFDFRPFATLEDAAAWTRAVLSPTERAEIWIAPGLYYIGAQFRCNVTIKGALGSNSFGAPDDPSESVIFYKNISVRGTVDNSGYYLIRDIVLNGDLTLLGPNDSYISRVFFMSPEDAYRKIYEINTGNPWPAGKTVIEDLLVNFLSRQYRNIYSDQIIDFPRNSRLIYILTSGNCRVIRKDNGSLNVSQCVFYGQVTRNNTESSTPSCYFWIRSAEITLNGCSFRGMAKFTVPKQFPIGGITLGTNTYSYSFIDTSIDDAYLKDAYPSNANGVWESSTTALFYTIYGSTRSLFEFEGTSSLSICNDTNKRDNGIEENYNDDRNNLRLEKNHNSFINFNSSDYGSSLLGWRGHINLSDLINDPGGSLTLEQVFQNDFNNRGPLITSYIVFRNPGTQLTITGYSNSRRRASDRPEWFAGWKGQFSYIHNRDITSAPRTLQGTSQRPYGWTYYNSATSCTLNQYSLPDSTCWNIAGERSGIYTGPHKVNIYASYYNTPRVSMNTAINQVSPQVTGFTGLLLQFGSIPTVFQEWKSVEPVDFNTPCYSSFGNTTNTSGTYVSTYVVYNFSISRAIHL